MFILVEPNGHDAVGMFSTITEVFDRLIPDWKRKIFGFTADGANVNGVRRAMSDPGGDNVSAKLLAAIGRRLMIIHCAPHRLQLAFKDAWFNDDYLQKVDDLLHKLHNHLKASTKASSNLFFWAHVIGDKDFIKDLGIGKARWLGQLKGMQNVEKTYLPLLAHLYEVYSNPSTLEQKVWAQDAFKFMLTWEFRFTIAACIDVLELAWKTKLLLERHLNVCAIPKHIENLKASISDFCKKSSTLADALAKSSLDLEALKVDATHSEKILKEMVQEKKNEVFLKVRKPDGDYKSKFFAMVRMEKKEYVKRAFQRIQKFADKCIEVLEDRFRESAAIFQALNIFEPSHPGDAEAVNESICAFADFHAVPGAELAPFVRELMSRKKRAQADQPSFNLDKNRDILWSRVLSEMVEEKSVDTPFDFDQMAVKILLSYLTMQGQSAECESMLSKRAHIKKILKGQGDTTLLNVYAIVQSNLAGGGYGGPAQHVVTQISNEKYARGIRRAVVQSAKHMTGRARPRVRSIRSDFGTKGIRKKYARKALKYASEAKKKAIQGCYLKFKGAGKRAAEQAAEPGDIMGPSVKKPAPAKKSKS